MEYRARFKDGSECYIQAASILFDDDYVQGENDKGKITFVMPFESLIFLVEAT